MNNRYIVDDLDEARNVVLKKKMRVFTLLLGRSEYRHSGYDKYLSAFLSEYHVHLASIEFENIIRMEGIELEFEGTDFGLEEIVVTKIK